jgi:hypothetical protein
MTWLLAVVLALDAYRHPHQGSQLTAICTKYSSVYLTSLGKTAVKITKTYTKFLMASS